MSASPSTQRTDIDFGAFVKPAVGLSVSHVWRGYGSAIFLELGELSERVLSSGRKLKNPVGEWTIMIEWSWRLEGKRMIWCGSWSDQEKWMPSLQRLLGGVGDEARPHLPVAGACRGFFEWFARDVDDDSRGAAGVGLD